MSGVVILWELVTMAFDFGGGRVSWDAASCEEKISEGVEMCPFLRNIGVTTSFAFSDMKFPVPAPVSLIKIPLLLYAFWEGRRQVPRFRKHLSH